MILQGDVRDVLKTLPDASVNCCVTSPPYWGLRDYGAEGQLGLEKTPEEYVQNMVDVFREVRRVLRDDGTLWLNLGDTYVGTQSKGEYKDPKHLNGRNGQVTSVSAKVSGLKPKDLVGIPWMVAFALRADGWYLRSDIIWHKPNPMPESVKDRPTKAHEYLFLLSKSERYYYDAEAIKEPIAAASVLRLSQNVEAQQGSVRANGGTRADRPMKAVVAGSKGAFGPEQSRVRMPKPKGNAKTFRGGGKYTGGLSFDNSGTVERGSHGNVPNETGLRNRRTVWTIATKPYREAHFATYPPALVEPCILAGCPPGGTVFDPFFGSGTTGQVADQHNRQYIGIELNPNYIEIAKRRLSAVQPKLM